LQENEYNNALDTSKKNRNKKKVKTTTTSNKPAAISSDEEVELMQEISNSISKSKP
jgi:hypothetical protein